MVKPKPSPRLKGENPQTNRKDLCVRTAALAQLTGLSTPCPITKWPEGQKHCMQLAGQAHLDTSRAHFTLHWCPNGKAGGNKWWIIKYILSVWSAATPETRRTFSGLTNICSLPNEFNYFLGLPVRVVISVIFLKYICLLPSIKI